MQSGARSLLVLGFTILDDLINYNEPDVRNRGFAAADQPLTCAR